MIVVVVGGLLRERDQIVEKLMHFYPARVQKLNLSFITDDETRLARLARQLPSQSRLRRYITVVMQPQNHKEVALLRERGAQFMHVYGSLTKHYRWLRIAPNDLQVSIKSNVPDHVFTPDEAISECLHQLRSHDDNHQSRRARQ